MEELYIVPANDSTDISHNIKVTLNIVGALPFISINQSNIGTDAEDTDSETVTYKEAVNTSRLGTLDNAEVGNSLYDPDNPDRFTYFAYASSNSGSGCHLVHDDLKKCVYMLPVLRSFGDNELSSCNVNISVWKVGFIGDVALESIYNSPNAHYPTISKPKKHPYNTVSTFITAEKLDGGSNNNNYGATFEKGYIESNTLGTLDVLSMGKASDIFDNLVPVYRRIETNFRKFAYVYVGKRDANDLCVPLPF